MDHSLADSFRALAPALPVHRPKSFHAFGITHHFTAAQGEVIAVVLLILIAVAIVAGLSRLLGGEG